jgi:hypothetical protein
MNATTTLPIWILVLFCILLIGFITLIYSRGNWRTALAFVGIAITVFLIISGINAWSVYIKTHFVGQFDQLGIPFREAGPDWPLIPASWPLWLVPSSIFALLALGLGWWLHQKFTQTITNFSAVKPLEVTAPTAVAPPTDNAVPAVHGHTQINLSLQLEFESIKHELAATKEKLATAIEIAEEQVDKNQDLEIQLAQLDEEQKESIDDLQDKITALELELSAKESQNDELTTLALEQAEAISKLKEQQA